MRKLLVFTTSGEGRAFVLSQSCPIRETFDQSSLISEVIRFAHVHDASMIVRGSSYLAMFVHVVVRQLDLLERDDLLPQLFAGKGRVGVHVKSRGCRRIRFASLQPAAAMIGVSIPLIVDRHDVHQHGVTTVGLEPAKGHSARREHPPVKRHACETRRNAAMIR